MVSYRITNDDKEIVIKPVEKQRVRTHRLKLSPFCRHKEFAKMAAISKGELYVNNGTPYKSRLDIMNEEYKKSKKKWLTKSGFLVNGGKSHYKIIENYAIKDPSPPPVLHKFRATNKDKWVAGSFKLS